MPASSTDATGSAANDTANATTAQAISTPLAGRRPCSAAADRAHGQEHGEAGRQRVGRRHGTRTQAVTHLVRYFSPANRQHQPS